MNEYLFTEVNPLSSLLIILIYLLSFLSLLYFDNVNNNNLIFQIFKSINSNEEKTNKQFRRNGSLTSQAFS